MGRGTLPGDIGTGRACQLCLGISDVNLFGYGQGVIHFDAQISDRAFDLGMPEQKLDGPEIARPPIDQGRFCASQRVGPEQPRQAKCRRCRTHGRRRAGKGVLC